MTENRDKKGHQGIAWVILLHHNLIAMVEIMMTYNLSQAQYWMFLLLPENKALFSMSFTEVKKKILQMKSSDLFYTVNKN